MARNRDLDGIERRYGILWRFDTARYTIAFWAEDEDLDPADSFSFEDHIAFAREDDPAHWFCAFVGVFNEAGEQIGADVLGGCSYKSFEEFYSSHRDRDPRNRNCSVMRAARGGNVVICHYFPGMVREAVREARGAIALQSEGARRA